MSILQTSNSRLNPEPIEVKPPGNTGTPFPVTPSITNLAAFTDAADAIAGINTAMKIGHREAVVQNIFKLISSFFGFGQAIAQVAFYGLKAVVYFKLFSNPVLPFLLYSTGPLAICITALGLLVATIAGVAETIGIIKTTQFKNSIFTNEHDELLDALHKFDKTFSDPNSTPSYRFNALEKLNQAVSKAEHLGAIKVPTTGQSLSDYLKTELIKIDILKSTSKDINLKENISKFGPFSESQGEVTRVLEQFREVCSNKSSTEIERDEAFKELKKTAIQFGMLDNIIISSMNGQSLKNFLLLCNGSTEEEKDNRKQLLYNASQSLYINIPGFYKVFQDFQMNPENLNEESAHQIFLNAKHAVLFDQLSKINKKYFVISDNERTAIDKLVNNKKSIPNEEKETAKIQFANDLKKAKESALAYRVHPWLQEKIATEVPTLAAPGMLTTLSNDEKALDKPVKDAEQIMTSIRTQCNKQLAIHIIGLITVALIITALIVSIAFATGGCPFLVIIALVGASIVGGMIRQGLYYGSLGEEGWSFSPAAYFRGMVPECIRNLPKTYRDLRETFQNLDIKQAIADLPEKIKNQYEELQKLFEREAIEDLIDDIDEDTTASKSKLEEFTDYLKSKLEELTDSLTKCFPCSEQENLDDDVVEYVAAGKE